MPVEAKLQRGRRVFGGAQRDGEWGYVEKPVSKHVKMDDTETAGNRPRDLTDSHIFNIQKQRKTDPAENRPHGLTDSHHYYHHHHHHHHGSWAHLRLKMWESVRSRSLFSAVLYMATSLDQFQGFSQGFS